MQCVKCNRKAEVQVHNLHACSHCFLEIIEKRVRKELRTSDLIQKNDHVLLVDDGSASAKVSMYLFKKILSDLPLHIEEKKTTFGLGEPIEHKATKIVVPWSADQEGAHFIDVITTGKKVQFFGHYRLDDKVYMKLLLPVLLQEIELFADIKGFAYEKIEKSPILKQLDTLAQDHPDIKFGLLRSIEKYNK